MKINMLRAFIIAASALVVAPCLRASTVGLVDPFGSASTSSVGFAHWDLFSSTTFTADAPDTFDTDIFSGSLDSAPTGIAPPAGIYGSGQRFYVHSGAYGFTFNLTAADTIQQLSLQLKFTAPSVPALTFFNVGTSFSGATLATSSNGSVTEGTNTFQLVQYTWTGLNLGAGTNFTLTASSTENEGFTSLDGARVDATTAPIPEPATFGALAGVAILGWAALQRRRR
jgi:hypothetical protein